MAASASNRFANVSDKEISETKISTVPKSTQNATKYGVKLFKGVYFETLQTATLSTTATKIHAAVSRNFYN